MKPQKSTIKPQKKKKDNIVTKKNRIFNIENYYLR